MCSCSFTKTGQGKIHPHSHTSIHGSVTSAQGHSDRSWCLYSARCSPLPGTSHPPWIMLTSAGWLIVRHSPTNLTREKAAVCISWVLRPRVLPWISPGFGEVCDTREVSSKGFSAHLIAYTCARSVRLRVAMGSFHWPSFPASLTLSIYLFLCLYLSLVSSTLHEAVPDPWNTCSGLTFIAHTTHPSCRKHFPTFPSIPRVESITINYVTLIFVPCRLFFPRHLSLSIPCLFYWASFNICSR